MEKMDNNQTDRKSINLSKERRDSGNSAPIREAYPRYSSEPHNLHQKEYRNVSNSGNTDTPYKEMYSSGTQYQNIPPVHPQVSQPPVNYNKPSSGDLSHYYDYGNQSPVQHQPPVQPVQQNLKYCKYCGGRIPNDAVVCTLCGRQVETLQGGIPMQPNVSNQININQPMQGYQFPTSEKSKTTALVLALIGFTGIGGLHRLYAGKILSGLLYLCTFGLFGLGTLIDVLKISSNTFTDGAGFVIRK